MNYGSTRQTLLDNGYSPIPVIGKNPALDNWRENIAPEGYGGYNAGILCGKIAAVDIDITDKEIAEQLKDYALQICGETTYRIGKAPKVLLVYRSSGHRKKVSKRYDCGRIEVLGEGQQFVAFGTHPDTKRPYTWPGVMGSLLDIRIDSLPQVNDSQITDILRHFEEVAEAAGYTPLTKESELAKNCEYDPTDPLDQPEHIQDLTIERCKKILASINPDCSRDEWRNLGMAMHFQFKGSPEALSLWDEWSSKGAKYKAGEPEKQWDSFGQYSGRPLSGAYLLKQEKKEPVKNYVYIPSWKNKPEEIPAIVTLHGAKLLTPGNIGVVVAAPGVGKSAVCEAVSAARLSAQCDSFGIKVTTAKAVIYVDTERTSFDHWRSWVRTMYRAGIRQGTEPDNLSFQLISAIPDVPARRAFLYDLIDSGKYGLILVDGAADFVVDVNDPAECNTFSNEISAKCKQHNNALLMTIHSNPQVGNDKARGHLGSELMRRAESVLKIVKDSKSGIRSLTMNFDFGKNRNDFDDLCTHFVWDPLAEMFVSSEGPAESKPAAEEEAFKILSEIKGRMSRSEMIKEICRITGKKKSAAESQLRRWIGKEKITKKDNFYEVSL